MCFQLGNLSLGAVELVLVCLAVRTDGEVVALSFYLGQYLEDITYCATQETIVLFEVARGAGENVW